MKPEPSHPSTPASPASPHHAQASRMDETADNCGLAIIESDSPPFDEAADESLVRLARAGDEAAFEQIFERHKKQVARIAGRFFNRPEKIEEIVQEVFTKLYFALGDYSSERGASFSAWLSRIAINSCYDELRRMRRRPEEALGDITDEEAGLLKSRLREGGSGYTSTERNAESATISRDLARKLLARLSPDDRLVLTLLNAEELPATEIARLTGWSVSKVKVRAHRARTALRSVLGEFL
ncbi:MAG: sigma-70 family RNA polymerase sigma factor [Blastocatellia bacterium]|nr:sigma-70 family RNA polymerase sigma factor [Blastocatellia bacterium]